MPTLNRELLEETLTYIRDHPDEWDQQFWAQISERSGCGTALCFGGTAVVLAGATLTMTGPLASYCLYDGEATHIGNLAQKLLGLTTTEADMLFHGGNDLATVEGMVKDLLNGDNLLRRWDRTNDGYRRRVGF